MPLAQISKRGSHTQLSVEKIGKCACECKKTDYTPVPISETHPTFLGPEKNVDEV